MAYYGEDIPKLIGGPLVVGWLIGIVPFFIRFGTHRSTSVNGQVVSSSSIEYVALSAGAVVVVIGVIALVAAFRQDDRRLARIALAASVLLLGVFHLVRGVGIF